MSDEMKMLQVRITSNGEVVDESLVMLQEEMLAYKKEAVEQIKQRATQSLTQSELKRLVYVDEEGDACTFTQDTLEDALSFAVAGCDSVWVLDIRAVAEPKSDATSTQPSESANEQQAPKAPGPHCLFNGNANAISVFVQQALRSCIGGADIMPLLPKLATLALDIITTEQCDELYPLLDPIFAIKEGTVDTDSFPAALLGIIEVLMTLPKDVAMRLAARFKEDALKILVEFREEQAAQRSKAAGENGQPDSPLAGSEVGMEVHVHITCDGCQRHPIIGPRHKCLDLPDFDLCDQCYRREDRDDLAGGGPKRWEQRASGVFGDVVASYNAPVVNGCMMHHHVACDGCQMSPLVGRRHRCTSMANFDLCETCYARREEIVPGQQFEELICISVDSSTPHENDEPVVAPPESSSAVVAEPSVAQSQLEEMETRLMARMRSMQDDLESKLQEAQQSQKILASLLTHPDNHIRSAVEAAVQEAQREQKVEETDHVDAGSKTDEAFVADAGMAVHEEIPDGSGQEITSSVTPKLSALAMSLIELVLGVEAQEDMSARGDVTEEFADALHSAGVSQAYRIARAVLPAGIDSPVPACAKVCIINNGELNWPDSTVLQLVHGEGFGLAQMQLGAVNAGEAAEIVLDLLLPAKDSQGSARSAWALVDSETGSAFGPLLFFEAMWVAR